MNRPLLAVILALGVVSMAGCGSGESRLRRLLSVRSGTVRLPDGTITISKSIEIPPGADNLEIVGGNRTVLLTAADFHGPAMLVSRNSSRIRLRDFALYGNSEAIATPVEIPPDNMTFADFHNANGLLFENVRDLSVSGVEFRQILNFPILVSRSKKVRIRNVLIDGCGSRNARGRNNTTGGILLEEGTEDFQVTGSTFRKVLGNGVWTHSRFHAPRNLNGVIANNRFEIIGRDAIQIGHANNVRVEKNTGLMIGYPADVVDVAGGGIPVAIDTAGKFDEGLYAGNRFEEINGKCIDLDGFHDGEVRGNVCINRRLVDEYPSGHFGIVMNNTNPEMESQNIHIHNNVIDGTKFGGIFVIGTNHHIHDNRLFNLNKAGCNENKAYYGCTYFPNEPDLMQSGIYLGQRAERTALARKNTIENNHIHGHKMKTRCIGFAPTIAASDNTVRNNRCEDAEPR